MNSLNCIINAPAACTRKQAGVRMLCSYYTKHNRAVAGYFYR